MIVRARRSGKSEILDWNWQQVITYWRESPELGRQTGNRRLISQVLMCQATYHLTCAELPQAEAAAHMALAQARQIDNQECIADAVFTLAQVAWAGSDAAEAAACGQDSLALMEAANPRRSPEMRQWLDQARLSTRRDE
jgi:hypothetical protein